MFTTGIQGYNLGLRIVKPMGGVVCVGTATSADGPMEIAPSDIVRRGLSLVPGVGGTKEDFAEPFALHRSGKVNTHISRRFGLDKVNVVLSELEHSKYSGKAIIRISS